MSANAADAVVRPAASGASMRTMATRGKAHVGGTVRPGRSAKAPSAKTIITTEGAKGLYKGMLADIVRGGFAAMVPLVYQKIKDAMAAQ